MNRNKNIFMLFFGIILVAGFVAYFSTYKHAEKINIDGFVLPQAKAIDDFQLTDNHGKPFSKENLKGQWTMMFFGFTNCGMVCPTTMAALNDMYKTLQKQLTKDQLPQVVMISVDPDNDSVKRMNSYVTAFNPNFIGVRGDIKATVALENELHIAAAKMEVTGQGKNHYTINHSAEILLFNPKGELQAYLSYPHQADVMVKDYRAIISKV